MNKLEKKIASVLSTTTATVPLLTQATPDTKKDVESSFYFFGTVHMTGATLFNVYRTLVAILLLVAVYFTGAMRLATLRNVLLIVLFFSLIGCYFFSRRYALRAFAKVRPEFVTLLHFWQCFVQTVFGYLMARCLLQAPSAYSLHLIVFLAFLMLVQVWLMILFSYAVDFIDKKVIAAL